MAVVVGLKVEDKLIEEQLGRVQQGRLAGRQKVGQID